MYALSTLNMFNVFIIQSISTLADMLWVKYSFNYNPILEYRYNTTNALSSILPTDSF